MPESHNVTASPDSAAGLLQLAQTLQRLKQVPRQGWLDRGVSSLETESVADHSLGVALLAWMAAIEARADGADLDPTRVLMLALVHDLPEAEIGDWTPYAADEVTAHDDSGDRAAFLNARQVRSPERTAAKRAAEQAAIDRLVAVLGSAAATTLADLWRELAAGVSPEARFVKQADRLETFLQSHAYAASDPSLPMASFRVEAGTEITDPVLSAIRDQALPNKDSH